MTLSRLYSFGDSLTQEPNIVGLDYAYPALVAAKRGTLLWDRAVNGSLAADQYLKMLGIRPASGDLVSMLLGTNDERVYGADPLKLANYETILAAEAYYLTQNVSLAGAWANTGTWAAAPGQIMGLYSSAVGSTLQTTFTGPTLTFGYIIADAINGAFTATVDGVLAGTFNTQTAAPILTTAGITSGPSLGRITGFSSGPHTVVFTMTAPGIVYVEWIGLGPSGAKLVLCTVPRMTPAAYATYGGSDENVANYNTQIMALSKTMIGDGFPVFLADVWSVIDPWADLYDGVHPTAQGHVNIAAVVMAALG